MMDAHLVLPAALQAGSQQSRHRVLSTAGAAACATLVVVLLSWNTGSSSAGEVALAQQGQLGLMTMLSGDPYWDEHNVANASPYQLSTTPSQHWGGMGSEGYGTPQWDNTGWNAHYHPRDGASMDSESMEPWYWRKGPRVNDEYTGQAADGDPLFSPPDGWEPPVQWGKQ